MFNGCLDMLLCNSMQPSWLAFMKVSVEISIDFPHVTTFSASLTLVPTCGGVLVTELVGDVTGGDFFFLARRNKCPDGSQSLFLFKF